MTKIKFANGDFITLDENAGTVISVEKRIENIPEKKRKPFVNTLFLIFLAFVTPILGLAIVREYHIYKS